jgi:hypothetical protein
METDENGDSDDNRGWALTAPIPNGLDIKLRHEVHFMGSIRAVSFSDDCSHFAVVRFASTELFRLHPIPTKIVEFSTMSAHGIDLL